MIIALYEKGVVEHSNDTLNYASKYNKTDLIILLLTKNKQADLPPLNLQTALEIAIDHQCEEAAKELLTKNGYNEITPPKKKSPFLQFLLELLGLFNVLLMVSAILSIILFAIDSSSTVNVRG